VNSNFFKQMILVVCASFLLLGMGCGSLSDLSTDSKNESNPLSAIETESLQSLEDLLETPVTVSLTTEQMAEIDTLSTEAVQSQSNGDMASAVVAMEKVLAMDPTNATANFILGINDVNTMLQDPETKSELNRTMGLVSDAAKLTSISQGATLLSHPDQIQSGIINNILFVTSTQNMALQEVVKALEKNIPRLNSAIVRLQRMLRHNDFQYSVINESFGVNYTVTRSDVLGVYAALNVVRAVLDMGLAYDMQFEEGQYISTEEWFSKNPQFLTLRQNGVSHMHRAGVSFSNVITAILEDAKNPSHAIDPTLETSLRLVRRSLKGETLRVPFTLQNNAKTETVEHTLAVNLGNFFNSPIPDFRKYLGIHMKGTLEASSFPAGFDFTLGGLFPELNSYADWQTYNSFGLVFYNDEGAVGGSKLDDYDKEIQVQGTVAVVTSRYSYGDSVSAEVFRISGNSVVGSLGRIPGDGYTQYPPKVTLSDRYLYRASMYTLEVYDTSGNAISKIHDLSLDSPVEAIHVYQNRLYVITNSGIDRYSLDEPTHPTFLDSTGFTTSLTGTRSISFQNGQVSIMTQQWNYSDWNAYATTLSHYDLVSGQRTSVSTYQTGYGVYGVYVDGGFVSVLPRLDYSGYDVRWPSGVTSFVPAQEYGLFTFNNGFWSNVRKYSENVGFVVYDLRTPGVAKLVGDYKPFSGGEPSVVLPTENGLWIHNSKSKLQFISY